MARPPKKGLDYFPLDVAVFDDAKLCLLRSEFGIKGEYIYLRLLCRIYKEGYCIPWNNDEAALFALSIGQNTSPAMVNEVIQGCLRRSLFDKRVHGSFGILTAKGIQERYVFICKQLKRKPNITPQLDCCGFTQSAEEEVLEPAVSSAKSLITPEETPQSKRKETKKNEMKTKCVSNAQWLQQTSGAYGTDAHTLLNFCNAWIDKAYAKQKFESYGLNTLIGFMLDDFDKEKSCAKKEIDGERKTGRIATSQLEAFVQRG